MGGAGKLKDKGQIKTKLLVSRRERTGLFSSAGRTSVRSSSVPSGSQHPNQQSADSKALSRDAGGTGSLADLPAAQARLARNHTQVFTMGGVAPSRSESSGRGLVIASIVMRYLLCSCQTEKPAKQREEEAVTEIL